jgi:hypothetical protein
MMTQSYFVTGSVYINLIVGLLSNCYLDVRVFVIYAVEA